MQAKKTAAGAAKDAKDANPDANKIKSRSVKAAEAACTADNANILDPSTIPHNDTCVAGVVSYFLRRGIISVVCGSEHTCVMHVDGTYGATLYSFGKNTYGQCGSGNTSTGVYILPRRIRMGMPYPIAESDALMSALYCGGRTMGYLVKGQLYMWGWNQFGQVGTHNSFSDMCIPSPVAVKLGGGGTSSGSSTSTSTTPKPKPKQHNIINEVVNYRQTVVLTRDGDIYTWGYTDAFIEQTVGMFNRVNHSRVEALRNGDGDGSGGSGNGNGVQSGVGKLFSGTNSDSDSASTTLPTTVFEEDAKFCRFSPYLWSDSCGIVPKTSNLIGTKPIKYRHRPSELSSAAVSTKVSPFGPIFQFLPGFGTCSSATLSVLMFDRVKGIEVDEAVLSV